MKHRTRTTIFALVFSVALLAVYIFAPSQMEARRITPLVTESAPLSPEEAQARVEAAQQATLAQRTEIARNLGLTSPELLPLSPTFYVSETGYHISQRAGFLSFWRENGGAMVFGYPLSEEIIENGRIVQYFERARFEYHPDAEPGYRVQLSLLGRELTAGRDFPEGNPEDGTMYFPETKHTLSGKFLQFWLKRGGLPIFGYPISEPMEEVGSDGQMRTVQYFERARFEHYPERLPDFYRRNAEAYGLRLMALHEVELTNLGSEAIQRAGLQAPKPAPLAGAPTWSSVLWSRHIDVDLSNQWLTAYEGDTPVFRAPIATGKDGFNTPTGTYAIYLQYPKQTMTGSGGGETWYVPDVPWVQYVVGGVALHGTYWHDQWGTGVRMSHGCINLNIDDAQWLYEWAGVGVEVNIHY